VRAGFLPVDHAGRGRAPGRKKLRDAARRWATRGAYAVDEENTLAALKKFNATEQQLKEAREALQQRRQSEEFEVWPDNWRAWELFAALETQWRLVVGPGGGVFYEGIDYSVLDQVERRLPALDDEDLPDERTRWHQLQLLEREAKRHLNQRG
jgi:hypothetical protein